MGHRRKRLADLSTLEFQGNKNRETIKGYREKVEQFDKDPDKKDRLEKSLCKICYYIHPSRVGGTMITTTNCSTCDAEMTFASTNTDYVCNPCGMKYELCTHCGGDINLRVRRKSPELPGTK